MKTFGMMILLAIRWITVSAQPSAQYTYDASGNRIKREIVFSNKNLLASDSIHIQLDTTQQTMINTMGLSQMEQDLWSKVRVYPNPFSEMIYLDIPDDLNIVRAILYSSQGARIFSFEIKGKTKTIPCLSLQPGTYQLELRGKNRAVSFKVIKK